MHFLTFLLTLFFHCILVVIMQPDLTEEDLNSRKKLNGYLLPFFLVKSKNGSFFRWMIFTAKTAINLYIPIFY